MKLAVHLSNMANNDKVCIELAFTQKTSPSQRSKIKNFWKFMDSTNLLEPYKAPPESEDVKEPTNKDSSEKSRKKWYHELKTFQKHGLDKVALAAGKTCKRCNDRDNYDYSKSTDTLNEPFQELLDDIKAFEEKLNDGGKTNSDLESH